MFGKQNKKKKVDEEAELIDDELNVPDKKLAKQTKDLMGIRQPDEPEIEQPSRKKQEEFEEYDDDVDVEAPKITAPKKVIIAQIYKDVKTGALGLLLGEAFNPTEFYGFIMPHAKALEKGLKLDHVENLKKVFGME